MENKTYNGILLKSGLFLRKYAQGKPKGRAQLLESDLGWKSSSLLTHRVAISKLCHVSNLQFPHLPNVKTNVSVIRFLSAWNDLPYAKWCIQNKHSINVSSTFLSTASYAKVNNREIKALFCSNELHCTQAILIIHSTSFLLSFISSTYLHKPILGIPPFITAKRRQWNSIYFKTLAKSSRKENLFLTILCLIPWHLVDEKWISFFDCNCS